MRNAVLALLISLASPAVAAPVPKELTNNDVVKLFGVPTEPKDCSITFDKANKSIKLTAVPSPDQPVKNAPAQHVLWSPRTVCEVDGDFDVTVNITLPDQKDTTVTAGLYASYGEKDYVILGRTLLSDKLRTNHRSDIVRAIIKDGVWNAQGNDSNGTAEAFSVRLTKVGKTITHTN